MTVTIEQLRDHPEVRDKLRAIFLDLYGKMEGQEWKKSMRGGHGWSGQCLYRSPEGRCCMVGHLIPLEKFPDVPEKSVDELLGNGCKASQFLIDLNPGLNDSDWFYILERLQATHDEVRTAEEMKEEFLEYAAMVFGQPLIPKETP